MASYPNPLLILRSWIACGLFDGGTVLDFLNKVKTFVDANPNEVITLILTNPEKVSLTDVWKPIFDQSGKGFNDLSYPYTDPFSVRNRISRLCSYQTASEAIRLANSWTDDRQWQARGCIHG